MMMRRNLVLAILCVPLVAAVVVAQTTSVASANESSKQVATQQQSTKTELVKMASAQPSQAANPAAAANTNNELSAVLAKMNQTSAGFKSAQGDFEFQNYQDLTKDTDTQQGKIYFRRRQKGSVDAAFYIDGKAPRQVVYKNGLLQVYEQKIGQVTERKVDNNKADVEAFLSLGFGATGDDL